MSSIYDTQGFEKRINGEMLRLVANTPATLLPLNLPFTKREVVWLADGKSTTYNPSVHLEEQKRNRYYVPFMSKSGAAKIISCGWPFMQLLAECLKGTQPHEYWLQITKKAVKGSDKVTYEIVKAEKASKSDLFMARELIDSV